MYSLVYVDINIASLCILTYLDTYIFLIYNLTYQIELYIAGALLVHKKRYLTVPFNCFLHTQILC